MKKLITLFLALAGGVGTVSATTIYFVDNWKKDGFKIYYWGGDNGTSFDSAPSFPAASDIIDGFNVYELNVGDNTKFLIIFNDNGTKHQTVDVESISDGDYYEFDQWNEGTPTVKKFTSVYSYSYNVTTATEWDIVYFHCWDNSGNNVSTPDWPGQNLGKTFTCKSFSSDLKVIFHTNNGKQTGDLWAKPGDNKYYIASLASQKNNESWGEGVKTNAFGYATYVNYNPIEIPSGIAYYAIDNDNGSASAEILTNPSANTPMLVKGNANTIYHFGTAASGTGYTGTNAFKQGTGAAVATNPSGTIHNYILNDDTFYWAAGKTVPTNKAYLQLSQMATTANARILIFPGDDEAQGITAATTVKTGDAAYYNLSGQRVNAPSKGLFIRDGKKVIIK